MMSASVAYVGLALWLADHGIGPERIGIINALPLIVVVLLSVSVGRLADRASDWRGAIVACSAVAAAASAALFFVQSFWAIAIVWTLTTAPLLLMIPVVDAATVRMAARIGVSHGAIRVSFGRLIDQLGAYAYFGAAAMCGLGALLCLGSLALHLDLHRRRGARPVGG